MGHYNIRVTEYGIKKKNGKIFPEHYDWDYCLKKKIPYIIVTPKIKYSLIDYDLFTVDNGLAFPENKKIIDYWWDIYEKYVEEVSFPKEKIPLRTIGEVTDYFTVFKKDQEVMVEKLMKEIEYFVNEYAILDIERKEYYEEIRKRNERFGF